jgi:hypothetical protein
MDEIEEILLHNTTSKLTAMVMQSWWDEEKRLKKELKDSKNYPAIEPKEKNPPLKHGNFLGEKQ